MTANPVNVAAHPALNRFEPYAKNLTCDQDVLRRQFFMLDVDPSKPADTSATAAERASALALRDRVVAALIERGWPEPACVSSGNGGQALYACDFPNTDEVRDLFERALDGLAAEFDTEDAHVDRGVFNASFIWKLPGTMARKGPNTPERPHRRAEIESVPDTWTLVTREQLRALAGDDSEEGDTAPSDKEIPDPTRTHVIVAAVLKKVKLLVKTPKITPGKMHRLHHRVSVAGRTYHR